MDDALISGIHREVIAFGIQAVVLLFKKNKERESCLT
jgi:hypothetical protein